MKIFAFGSDNDPIAWKVADKLEHELPGVEFIKTNDPDDIAPEDNEIKTESGIIIMDGCGGISKPTRLSIEDIRNRHAVTTHDVDLGLTLKLFKKSGRIQDASIVGIPVKAKPNKKTVEMVRKLLVESYIEKTGS